MNKETIERKLVSVEDLQIKRICRYAYEGILYLNRKSGIDVGYNGIYSQVRIKFEDRKNREDKPYFEDYSYIQKTKMIIESLVILEQLKLIELNEETGRYRLLITK